MRVLAVGNMYPPHHLGGYELMWRSAVRHLRARGHQVRVLTTDYRRADAEADAPDEPDVHRELRWYWRDHRVPPIGKLARLGLERRNAAVLDRHLRELRPDVVSWWAMGAMSLSLIERVRRAGVPAAGTVVDDWMLYGPVVDAWTAAFASRPLLGSVARRLTGIPTRFDPGAAASWLFVSEATRRRAEADDRSLPRTEVAHGGVDLELFRPAPVRPWRWRLLYLGRIEERKGIDLAVRALPLLPEDALLTIAGAGDAGYLGQLRGIASELGIGDRVTFTTRRHDEVPAAYADADVLLFPVRWPEPFGLVPLEAMAVGTPVLATGRGGSGEYLSDEENCLIFDPDRGPEALAAGVRRLAEDERLRARLRDAGLATAARFDERSFNERVERALTRAAAPGQPG